ncbi:TIR domain-containing protein [uncultured Parabacteroides sp.]|uniref:TIR domain-containing protein n=1 Tax=uncultured Parabacteroides sp. TaxID=512312 RepID=UPI0020522843|nr:TIR domain-containing protein [uncultured Parabacteroides sp.]DAJ56839.1 MAG TPA: putative WRKY transcription factor [Caudoviricetes sp.]
MAYLEDVFKDSGVPTHTFVEPNEYTKIVVALRTKGRCLVVEGPSGIGKTTCVLKALENTGLSNTIQVLTPRKKKDISVIHDILTKNENVGTVIIDDFHLLTIGDKNSLSDLMKTIADEEREDIKLVLIGINRAGDSLINLAPDLNNRITTVKFEVNPDSKILELVEKGEEALQIEIKYKEQIVKRANGSFHIAQLLCKELCIIAKVLMTLDKKRELNTDINYVVDKIMSDLSRVFENKAREFAIGSRLRSSGRAPYFHLLYWLSLSKDWTIRMTDIYLQYPNNKASISQVADKGFLSKLINNSENIKSVIHYDEYSKVLTVEDPKFMFYLQNINWHDFVKRIGFSKINFDSKYDFALSFAGEVRSVVSELSMVLSEEYECSVFYDFNEQHKILGEDLTDYFEPIYSSEAEFIIVFLDKNYPKKLWTNFESDKFKKRFGEHAIIPIIFKGCEPTQFDKLANIGYYTFDPEKESKDQIRKIADLVVKKLDEKRREGITE